MFKCIIIIKLVLPLRSLCVRSQFSKHSPQGLQFGAVPKYPLAQVSHFSPPIPNTQLQCPIV